MVGTCTFVQVKAALFCAILALSGSPVEGRSHLGKDKAMEWHKNHGPVSLSLMWHSSREKSNGRTEGTLELMAVCQCGKQAVLRWFGGPHSYEEAGELLAALMSAAVVALGPPSSAKL